MCGFVGFLGGLAAHGELVDEALLKRMADTIGNRGPDDAGYWSDVEQRIGFGHRRLSIVDLSPAGHQPMVSGGGRYVIAFNGEIYNHLDCRAALAMTGRGDGLPRCAFHEPAVIANVVWQSMNPLFSTMDRRAGRHCEERSDAAIAMTAGGSISVCGVRRCFE